MTSALIALDTKVLVKHLTPVLLVTEILRVDAYVEIEQNGLVETLERLETALKDRDLCERRALKLHAFTYTRDDADAISRTVREVEKAFWLEKTP